METSGGGSRFSKGNVLGQVVGPRLGHPPLLHCGGSPHSRQPPSSEPCGTHGTAIWVSQHGPAAPKCTLTRLRCTQRVSAPARETTHCRHASRCPFLQLVRPPAQRNIPVFRSKMIPNCTCRQEAAARPWPAVSASLLSPGNIYCAYRSASPPASISSSLKRG